MVAMAGTYLLYCDCVRRATGERRQIVAAVTNGDADNLMVGRNGIFYDRDGLDWDATITKIVDNPISLRQAFWAPYKKLVRLIEEQVAKRAAAADAAATQKLETAAVAVTTRASAATSRPAVESVRMLALRSSRDAHAPVGDGSRPEPQRELQSALRRWEGTRAHLDAGELVELGVQRGPALGETLRRLRRERYLGTLTGATEAKRAVRAWLAEERADDT